MFSGRNRFKGLARYLAPQERVILTSRRHPIVVIRPVILWFAALVLGAGAGFIASPRSAATIIDQIAGWIVLIATIYVAIRVWQWWIALYVVTDQRVLLIEGVLSRKVASIPLPKVTDTTYSRRLSGRLLGFGTLALDSPGETPGLSTLTYIPHPDRVYRLVTSLVVSRVWDKAATPTLFREDEDTGPIPRIIA